MTYKKKLIAQFLNYFFCHVPRKTPSKCLRCMVIVNPRRACARVTVVVLCVCVCVCVSVHGSNLLVAQLRDKLVILTGSVSWSLQNLIWRFSYNGFVSKIAIAFPYYELTVYSRPFYTRNGLIFRTPPYTTPVILRVR